MKIVWRVNLLRLKERYAEMFFFFSGRAIWIGFVLAWYGKVIHKCHMHHTWKYGGGLFFEVQFFVSISIHKIEI